MPETPLKLAVPARKRVAAGALSYSVDTLPASGDNRVVDHVEVMHWRVAVHISSSSAPTSKELENTELVLNAAAVISCRLLSLDQLDTGRLSSIEPRICM